VWGWPLVTTGRVRAILPVYLVGVPLNVAISIAGCYWVGGAGPALGSAVSLAVIWLPWLPLLLRCEFGTPLGRRAAAVASPAALGAPLAVALYALSGAFPLGELGLPIWGQWLALAGFCAAGFAGYLVLAWFLVLPREDRAELRARVLGR